jgi:hypothetical protein
VEKLGNNNVELVWHFCAAGMGSDAVTAQVNFVDLEQSQDSAQVVDDDADQVVVQTRPDQRTKTYLPRQNSSPSSSSLAACHGAEWIPENVSEDETREEEFSN